MLKDLKLNIIASDIDRNAIKLAKENAENLFLENDIQFIQKDFRNLNIKEDYGVIICNPPLMERE